MCCIKYWKLPKSFMHLSELISTRLHMTFPLVAMVTWEGVILCHWQLWWYWHQVRLRVKFQQTRQNCLAVHIVPSLLISRNCSCCLDITCCCRMKLGHAMLPEAPKWCYACSWSHQDHWSTYISRKIETGGTGTKVQKVLPLGFLMGSKNVFPAVHMWSRGPYSESSHHSHYHSHHLSNQSSFSWQYSSSYWCCCYYLYVANCVFLGLSTVIFSPT